MGHVRTSRWLIAGTTTLALVATPLVAAVPARAAAPHVEVGLYGTTDPTYDGVFRQSLAILGLHAAGIAPRPEALAWLERQQCADGGFPSYNPDPSKPCPAFDPGQFTGGEDTNATALAAQALLVAGRPARATRAVTFLRGLQNPDGGWELIGRAGSGSDPNSTGLVLTALSAAKVTAKDSPQSSVAYFATLQVGRPDLPGADLEHGGGIATPYSNGAPDVLATVQAIPGLRGATLTSAPPLGRWRDAVPAAPASTPPATVSGVSGWAAHWLGSQPPTALTGSSAPWAVLSFAWDRTGEDAAYQIYADHVAGKVPAANPGANGQAALAAAVLGNRADVAAYARNIAATLQRDTTAPLANVVVPKAAKHVSSWKRVDVRATDAGSGVAAVKVAANLKHSGTWFRYTGKKWVKAKNGKATRWVRASAAGTTWRVRLPGLTTGRLVLRVTATDLAGNHSAPRKLTQQLTKRK